MPCLTAVGQTDTNMPLLLFLLLISADVRAEEQTFTLAEEPREVVVLLHGFGRNKAAMWLLAARLERAGYEVRRIGYNSFKRTPEEILDGVMAEIESCCRSMSHAPALHFVGHSFGGLLARAYLQTNQVSNLGRVVLIGTPNQGTIFVDRFRDTWWLRMLGPTALALGTSEDSFPSQLEPPYYEVGVIAGSVNRLLRNESYLPGDDDGIIPIEATHLEGMQDFLVVRTSHGYLRYDKHVADQTIAFLQHGQFNRSPDAIEDQVDKEYALQEGS